jgi:cyclic pyranopterin phosphate synthase
MPEAGVRRLRHNEILRVEEIEEIAIAAASLGIEKIRITGGEPLIRRSIVDIVRRVAAAPGIREVALTTNAVLLPQFAAELKEAGLARVNVSIDTLDPEKYREITRGGEVADVLRGIEAAIAADLTPIKLNAVLMGGVNEDAIRPLIKMTEDADFRVRFIEVMPIGECAGWNQERFIGISRVLEEEPGLKLVGTDGVSKLYRKEGSIGSVGLISPISSHFCPSCNKIRVTSDGKLKPCLHSAEEIPLKGLHGEELTAALRKGILDKPYKHRLESKEMSNSARGMSAIGG